MKKWFSLFLAAAMAVGLNAQEFGSEATAEEAAPVGSGEAVQEVQKVMEEEPAPAPTAKEMIEDYFNSKENWTKGYNEETDQIIVTSTIEFDVKNPKVSADFLDLRKEKMSELLLMAKSKIIETIMSQMSGERILNVPGNPIAKQVEKEYKEVNKALADALEQIAILDADFAEAAKEKGTVSASELLATVSSWFTRSDGENIAASYDADKKERYENLKQQVRDAEQQYAELSEKAEEIKGTISKEMKTSLSRLSQMPIYGCTVLQQAESIREKNGKFKYQIAILYSWSGEMQKAAGQILQGESIRFNPGKKSVKKWISDKAKKGVLSQWIGPRQFIDDKGNMWFLGIACSPVDEDDADQNVANEEMAGLEAAAEVMFALYSDASSSKTLEKLAQTRRGADGEADTKVFKDYSKTQSESFKNIQIAGNTELWSGEVRHVPSGLDMHVVVYGVNSGSVKSLKAIQARAVALGIEVNTAQERERGRQAQFRADFEASKNNAAARAEGARQAKSEVQAERAKLAAERAAQKKAAQNSFQKSSSPSDGGYKTSGQLQAGSMMFIDDDEE